MKVTPQKALKIFFIVGLLVSLTCDTAPTGQFVENGPPETFLTFSKIDREGDFRLSSQINISWWGRDVDGYVVGYEYAINDTSEGNWTFTTRTDSTFILPIEEGNSIADVLFKVRAIDNDGAVDQVGARLVFPIVNSVPEVEINPSQVPADTMFSIASFGWSVDDIDGISNILRTEVVVNDTTGEWIEIPFSEEESSIFINLQVDNSLEGEQTADVFLGRGFRSAPEIKIPGVLVGAQNTFYVRAIDNAGAVSTLDSTSWYLKPKKSNTLFINDVVGLQSEEAQEFHLDVLNQVGIQPDIWLVNDGEVLSEAFPRVTDPTLNRTLSDWDHIYWISSNVNRNISFALELTGLFFENGGSMFVTLPLGNVGQNNEIFNFLPVDSIGVLTGIQTGFLVDRNSEITPVSGFEAPTLQVARRVSGVYPIKPFPGSTPLFEAEFKASDILGFNQDYEGAEAVVIENAEGNLIFFAFDMTQLTGNDNLPGVMDELLIDRLNFKQ